MLSASKEDLQNQLFTSLLNSDKEKFSKLADSLKLSIQKEYIKSYKKAFLEALNA
jgi:hypothetical protein